MGISDQAEDSNQNDVDSIRDSLPLAQAANGVRQWLNQYAGIGITMIPNFSGQTDFLGAPPSTESAANKPSPSDSNDTGQPVSVLEKQKSEASEFHFGWNTVIDFGDQQSEPGSGAQAASPGSAPAGSTSSSSSASPQQASPSAKQASPESQEFAGRLQSTSQNSAKSPPKSPAAAKPSQPTVVGARTSGSRFVADRRSGAGASAVDDGPDLDTFQDLQDDVRLQQLEIIQQEVVGCEACPELVANRSRTVFGQGPVRPRLLFMGEAPGADEDRQGLPMVGPAGQLLNKIISAMKMKREEVYVLNTIKCRPPRNRNPLETECASCRPFWRRQIEILKPECIVCLGAVAAKTLLQTNQPVGRMRGKMHNYRGVPVAVTYHPAYLLRTASAKRQTWDDMQKVMALLGIPVK